MGTGDERAEPRAWPGSVAVLKPAPPGAAPRPRPPKPPPRSRCRYALRIALPGTEPPIWRTFEVLGGTTLHRLHELIQVVMGWQDYHLYIFQIGPLEYGNPDLDEDGEILDARAARLCDALGHAGSACGYLYDVGDMWRHVLVLEAILGPPAGEAVPRSTGGARACPPEDVGGVHGFAEFLRAIADRRHPEHRAYLAWVGGSYDPAAFDVARVNAALGRFRPRRRPPKGTAHAPGGAGAEQGPGPRPRLPPLRGRT